MAQTDIKIYSKYTIEAMTLMGGLIRLTRKERRMTVQELADRAGISRGLLQRIEKGNPRCSIGSVFEVASILGLKLFQSDKDNLSMHNERIKDKIALLPENVRKPINEIDDDF